MRTLLDVNVLIALLDAAHTFHNRAHDWLGNNASDGWASCPLTENGFVRIMSNPSYSRRERFTPSGLIDRLHQFAANTNHEFWPDALSLRDVRHFDSDRIHSSTTLSDIYLLALAVNHAGRLATFDRAVSLSAVRQAVPAHLCQI